MEKNKDPAVLFYTADFLADTTMWNYEELGRYIKLLCLQHLQDGISEDDFKSVVGKCKRVADKFDLCEDGLYRNKRMQREADKRRAFSESRRANVMKRYENQSTSLPTSEDTYVEQVNNICSTSVLHMGNENINENININISNKHKYGSYKNVLLSDEEYDKLKTEYPSDYNERIERLSEYIASSGKKYKSHLATIRSWARKEGDKPQKTRYGDFDPAEAFNAALNRTYRQG